MDLRFNNVSFGYRSRDAEVLTELTLRIPAGRTILLGPNGAGKSTLLAIAASVLPLKRDRGGVAAGELTPRSRRERSAYRRRVAWMPQSVRASSGLSVRKHVALHGWLAGLTKSQAWDESLTALAGVDLQDMADRPATKLSGGQRARMGLAQALVHSADVFLLDEPTAALDPDQKDQFALLLNAIAKEKVVVVSSHDVSDLATSYDRVVVLADGRVRFDGTTAEFLDADGSDLTAVEAYRRASVTK